MAARIPLDLPGGRRDRQADRELRPVALHGAHRGDADLSARGRTAPAPPSKARRGPTPQEEAAPRAGGASLREKKPLRECRAECRALLWADRGAMTRPRRRRSPGEPRCARRFSQSDGPVARSPRPGTPSIPSCPSIVHLRRAITGRRITLVAKQFTSPGGERSASRCSSRRLRSLRRPSAGQAFTRERHQASFREEAL